MSEQFDAQNLRQLLPFHVNGSLTEDEQTAVDQALAQDAGLKTERAALDRLRSSMQEAPVEFTPGDFGLARLNRAIDAEAPANTTTAPTPRIWVPRLAAAIAVFALGLGTATYLGQDQYIQASGEQGGYDANDVLTVTFSPSSNQDDVTQLFLDLGLIIVDGPSAIGLYRVLPAEGTDLDQMAERLMATPVVDSVALP